MKKLALILLAVVMILSLVACSGGNEPAGNGSNTDPTQNATDNTQTGDDATMPSETGSENEQSDETLDSKSDDNSASEPGGEPEDSKILVAYFSATNNTEGVAQKLADGLGADLYEIVPEQPYTNEDLDYGNSKSRSSVEMDDPDTRPAISGSVENMEQYDIVFIGYPIWWGEAPRIMSTFVESYDFDHKTLVAFCTSASSGFGSSDSALKSATGTAIWLDGHRFSADASVEDVLAWANGLEID